MEDRGESFLIDERRILVRDGALAGNASWVYVWVRQAAAAIATRLAADPA